MISVIDNSKYFTFTPHKHKVKQQETELVADTRNAINNLNDQHQITQFSEPNVILHFIFYRLTSTSTCSIIKIVRG